MTTQYAFVTADAFNHADRLLHLGALRHAAELHEAALATALLTEYPMSATILRTLDLKRHLEWDADGIVVRIVLAEDETKNHRRLGFALSEDLSTRVKRHARVSRAHLRSSPNSTALFPGHGKMRLLRGHVLRPATDHAADPTRGMIYGCGKRADHSVTAARARNGQEGAVDWRSKCVPVVTHGRRRLLTK